jgi:N-methylhydantoinase A
VQRGIDPRDFALVGFGGAGPMHASRIADEFGIRTVVVPWGAGVASAIGLVSADLGAEHRRPFPCDLAAVDADELASTFADLEQRARAETGGDDGEVVVSRFVGVRVRGQVHALETPVDPGPLRASLTRLPDRFAEQYVAAYGVAPAPALQLTAARVRVVRRAPRSTTRVAVSAPPAAVAVPALERPAHFPERGGFVPTPVFEWAGLGPGARIEGPAIIEGADTTVVVLPERVATLDARRNVVLAR